MSSAPQNFVPYMPQGTATAESVAGTIQGALDLLGPNGENWTQDRLTEFRGTGLSFAYCVVGALERAAPDYQSYAAARDAVKDTLGSGNVDRWNNRATWPEVHSVLQLTLDRELDSVQPAR